MFLFRHSVCTVEKEEEEKKQTRRNIYKINECICYAPLNRLLSVYRPALRETISKLILFFLTLLLPFRFVCVVLGLPILNMTTVTNEKEIVILAGMFNVHFYSDLSSCVYDARRGNNSSYGSDIFSFAHMVLVDNKFDFSINGGDSDGASYCNELYIFFPWCCACFWSRKTSGSIVNDA